MNGYADSNRHVVGRINVKRIVAWLIRSSFTIQLVSYFLIAHDIELRTNWNGKMSDEWKEKTPTTSTTRKIKTPNADDNKMKQTTKRMRENKNGEQRNRSITIKELLLGKGLIFPLIWLLCLFDLNSLFTSCYLPL